MGSSAFIVVAKLYVHVKLNVMIYVKTNGKKKWMQLGRWILVVIIMIPTYNRLQQIWIVPAQSQATGLLFLVVSNVHVSNVLPVRYSRAKSGVADSHCGVKLGAENSLSGFNHCVITF